MRLLKLLGNIFVLFCTFFLTIAFSVALKGKIENPHFKNLNTKEFIICGILLIGLIFISFKIVSAYFKKN